MVPKPHTTFNIGSKKEYTKSQVKMGTQSPNTKQNRPSNEDPRSSEMVEVNIQFKWTPTIRKMEDR